MLEWRSAQVPEMEVAATPSWSLAPAEAAQQVSPRRQRPSARSAQVASSPAVAQTPCCDLPAVSAWQPGAAQAQLVRREEAQQRLAQAEAEAAQQRLSQPRPQPARAASSLAAARRPCSDRRVAPVRRRQPEPEAAAVQEQLLAQVEVPASAQVQAAVAAQRSRRRQAQPVPAASSPAAARTPCSDRRVAPVRRRQSEPVEAAAVRTQRSVQAEAAAPVQAAVPALRRPAAVQALAVEGAARPARSSSRRA